MRPPTDITISKKLSPPSNWQVSHLYSLFSVVHVINKLSLYMNSRYWGKTVIKLSDLTNNVCNFSNSGSKTEKSSIKTSMLAGDQLVMQAVPGNGLKKCWHVSTQGTLALEHVSMLLGTSACDNARHVGTWACKHTRHMSMQHALAVEHVFSTKGTQFSRLTYFIFNSYWLCFNFWICFISLCSCWYYKFLSRNKNLCNHSRN